MRAFLALFLCYALALFPTPALAGEEPLGVIISGAGADTTNGSTATPFVIPPGSKLTLNCTAAAHICTDTASACVAVGGGAQFGVPVGASTNFPTSVRPQPSVAPTITISGKTSSILRIVGSAAVTCYVWIRQGNE